MVRIVSPFATTWMSGVGGGLVRAAVWLGLGVGGVDDGVGDGASVGARDGAAVIVGSGVKASETVADGGGGVSVANGAPAASDGKFVGPSAVTGGIAKPNDAASATAATTTMSANTSPASARRLADRGLRAGGAATTTGPRVEATVAPVTASGSG